MRKARSSILNIGWCLRKRDRQSPIEMIAQLEEKSAHRRMRLCLTRTRGPRIHGERSNNGVVGSGGLDNSGANHGENGERNNQRGAAGGKNNYPNSVATGIVDQPGRFRPPLAAEWESYVIISD